MFLVTVFLAFGLAHGQAMAPGTPVVLTGGFPVFIKSQNQRCKQLANGDKGIVRQNPYSDDQTLYVEWQTLGKDCSQWERKTFVNSSAVKQSGPAPKGAKIPTVCKPKPVSQSPEAKAQHAKWRAATEQKSDDEIERYLSCYPSKNYQRYVSQYKEMVEIVAEEYSVDPGLMKCLINRESTWDPNLISCGCAIGLGQQIRPNIDRIDKAIGESRGRINTGTLGKNRVEQAWDNIMRRIAKRNPQALQGCTGNFKYSQELKKDSAQYKELIANRENCGKSAQECKLYAQDDRRCGPASLAALGAYLRLIDSIVRDAQNCGQIEDWQVNDTRIVFALAYNSGEGTAQNALKLANPNNLASLEFLKHASESSERKKELRNHYEAIRNCLQKGATAPPYPGGTDKKACVNGYTVEAKASGTPGNPTAR